MSRQENITRIKVVHDALGDLAKDCVFVGGATVDLYAQRPALELRPTDDVDVIIELLNYKTYAAVEERLRKKGFVNDRESGILCRYFIQGVIVDIMPTTSTVLGFANKWYADGFKDAIVHVIDADYSVRILRPDYFIATKLEAFANRGKGDGRTSSDFEDIVYVLIVRNDIFLEMKNAPAPLRNYLMNQFRTLLKMNYIDEWISAHVEYEEQRRVGFIIGGLQDFVRGKK